MARKAEHSAGGGRPRRRGGARWARCEHIGGSEGGDRHGREYKASRSPQLQTLPCVPSCPSTPSLPDLVEQRSTRG